MKISQSHKNVSCVGADAIRTADTYTVYSSVHWSNEGV